MPKYLVLNPPLKYVSFINTVINTVVRSTYLLCTRTYTYYEEVFGFLPAVSGTCQRHQP
jgi:hypothetical protein